MRNIRMSTQHTCMRTRKCGNVRACMRVCVRAYVCACMCKRECAWVCVCMRACLSWWEAGENVHEANQLAVFHLLVGLPCHSGCSLRMDRAAGMNERHGARRTPKRRGCGAAQRQTVWNVRYNARRATWGVACSGSPDDSVEIFARTFTDSGAQGSRRGAGCTFWSSCRPCAVFS
jgi:hypothetical protein